MKCCFFLVAEILYEDLGLSVTVQKKFPIKDFFGKCDQTRSFCAVCVKLEYYLAKDILTQ